MAHQNEGGLKRCLCSEDEVSKADVLLLHSELDAPLRFRIMLSKNQLDVNAATLEEMKRRWLDLNSPFLSEKKQRSRSDFSVPSSWVSESTPSAFTNSIEGKPLPLFSPSLNIFKNLEKVAQRQNIIWDVVCGFLWMKKKQVPMTHPTPQGRLRLRSVCVCVVECVCSGVCVETANFHHFWRNSWCTICTFAFLLSVEVSSLLSRFLWESKRHLGKTVKEKTERKA